ncbi:hypothetical protein [Rhodococcus qingshengii]
MSDIIDEIDTLVDEQLSGYHDRSGYDYNVNQDRCGHRHREWHGLKITERMESMAAQFAYDEDYRYADDDSDVLCPGSSFIGPWATKRQIERMRLSELGYLNAGWIQHQGDPSVVQAMQRYAFPQRVVLGASLPGESIQSNPYVHWRESGDRGIESTSWSAPRIRNNPFARRPYQEPRQLVRGDVVVMTVGGERRHVTVVVDIIEGDDGTTSFVTEDPRYSTRAQQLRDALAREQASAREAAIRGAEASQVTIDEGRPYRYGEDFSFADQWFPPEVQFPREWPDFAGALRRILEMTNPFDPAAWAMTVGDPEPDTRTPQERALPRPSTTPPMWAVDAGRQRRTRTNSRRRHR